MPNIILKLNNFSFKYNETLLSVIFLLSQKIQNLLKKSNYQQKAFMIF